MSGVRVTMQVPIIEGVRVLVDRDLDEFRVLIGRWDVSCDGTDLVIREANGGYDTPPLLKVPAR